MSEVSDIGELTASSLRDPMERDPVRSVSDESETDSAEDSEVAAVPEPPRPRFPYGRPTPDWVFEQKYAGISESEFALAREEVSAAYALASKRAFQNCWDAGEFELIPIGQPQALPGDDRIIGGRVLPGASASQVVRLSVDEHAEVYELFYEHLWLATTAWRP